MKKNSRLKAQDDFSRAKLLYEAKQFKKAGKFFGSAAKLYLEIKEFEDAKRSFIEGAKCYSNLENHTKILEFLRNAGDASLFDKTYFNALEIFKKAIEYVPSVKKDKDRNYYYVIFSALFYLCSLLKGEKEKGLELFKKIKSKVEDSYFKENLFVKFVVGLNVAIRENNQKKLNKIEEEFENFAFPEAEENLAKLALLLAKINVSITTDLKIDKESYTTNELLYLTLIINAKTLSEISANSFYNYNIKGIKIIKMGVTLSDNLAVHKKPTLPYALQPGQENQIEFVIKPHFLVNNPFIGPISLTCELNEKFTFFLESHVIKPNLKSPVPSLEIFTKNLRPPLLDQAFPFEILIKNKSEGEALDIIIELFVPNHLKLIRGTLKKQIYSLRSNEDMTWEIQLKPIEKGDYTVKIDVKFKDPDSNIIEQTIEVPISIKI